MDFQTVSSERLRDYGIDGFLNSIRKTVFQMYFPMWEANEPRHRRVNKKLSDTCHKLETYRPEIEEVIGGELAKLILVIPEDPDIEMRNHQRRLSEKFAFEIEIWGESEVNTIFSRQSNVVRDFVPYSSESVNVEDLVNAASEIPVLRRPYYEEFTGDETAARGSELLEASNALFVGREDESKQLDDLIRENKSGYLLIQSRAGVGKTALLGDWIVKHQQKASVIYHFFSHRYKESNTSIALALRNILRQLYAYYGITNEVLPAQEHYLRDAINGILRRGCILERPLVFVLDALDEAERPFYPPFPSLLPDGVFVVASARGDTGVENDYLQGWDEGFTMFLELLPVEAIACWIGQAGSGELGHLAKDETFILEVSEKTEGFPLYLFFLVDELLTGVRAGKIATEILERTPRGFEKYVEAQWRLLASQVQGLPYQNKVEDLFALLSIVHGPLIEVELQEITGVSAWELSALPWPIVRWFSISERGAKRTYAFAHELLGKAFERLLGVQAAETKLRLLDYCARWEQHLRPYALFHYAAHLLEEKRFDELFNLAKNNKFREAQLFISPENDLPLQTIRMALTGAIVFDTPVQMAEFVLAHAKSLKESFGEESPLDAYAARDIRKALKLSDAYQDQVPIVWKLLIAFLLVSDGKANEAATVLQQLANVRGPKLYGWFGDLAALVLSFLHQSDETLLMSTAINLLTNYDLRHLGIYFAQTNNKNSVALSLRVLNLIADEDVKDKSKSLIASALAQAGHWEAALEVVRSVTDVFDRAWGLSDLSGIALEHNNLELAEMLAWDLEILKENVNPDDRQELHWQISKAFANVAIYLFGKESERAEGLIINIRELANESKRLRFKASILADLSTVYASCGNLDKAGEVLHEATECAELIRLPREAARVFAYVGRRSSKAGLRTLAMDLYGKAASAAQLIEDRSIRSNTQGEIAKDYAFDDDFATAIEIANGIEGQSPSSAALASIADIAIEKGKEELAYSLSRNRPYKTEAWVLAKIGIGFLGRGQTTSGLSALAKALDSMRIDRTEIPVTPTVQAWAYMARAFFLSGDQDKIHLMLRNAVELAALDENNRIGHVWHLIDIARCAGKALNGQSPFDTVLSIAYEESKLLGKKLAQVWLQCEIARTMHSQKDQLFDSVLENAKNLLTGITDSIEKTQAFCEVGETLIMVGHTEKSSALFDKAYETAMSIRLTKLQKRALGLVAFYCANSGLTNRAKDILGITGLLDSNDGLKACALVYAVEDQLDQAVATARKIADAKHQAQALRCLAIREVRCGRILNAVMISKVIISVRDTDPHPIEIPRITQTIAEAADASNFKKLLIFNSYRLGSAYRMIGLLAILYPAHVAELYDLLDTALKISESPDPIRS